MKVIPATGADIPWIASELQEFFLSLNSKHSFFPPTQDLLYQELQGYIDNHVLLVAWGNGERTGVIGGLVESHPWNPSVVLLSERFWWVPLERRGSRAGYLLLREFMKMGDAIANIVVMGLEHNSQVSDRMMERFSLKKREILYVKEV